MIKFNWKDKPWTIRFTKLFRDMDRNGKSVSVPCGTIATITNEDDRQEEYEGVSFCNLDLDTFNPETGRKLALARALDVMTFIYTDGGFDGETDQILEIEDKIAELQNQIVTLQNELKAKDRASRAEAREGSRLAWNAYLNREKKAKGIHYRVVE